MDFPSVGHGQNDFFVFQARAFLDQIAGVDGLPPCPTSPTACTTCALLDAVVASAQPAAPRSRLTHSPQRRDHPMKLGAYTACLHDRPLAEALKILARAGPDSAEINAGGFLPAPHLPIDDILASAGAREEYLGLFAAGRHRR